MRAALFSAAVTAICLAVAPRPASADGLSPTEASRLVQGETVVREQSLERAGRRYVGGLAYALLDAPASQLAAVLTSTEAWRRILPRVHRVQRVGASEGDSLIEITQGTALLHATYTIRLHRQGNEIRFWMDPSRPHGIEDAWGFVRVEPNAVGKTLVTYGVLIDIGPGLLRDLLEERVRTAAMSVPDRVRRLVGERAAAPDRVDN